MKKTCFRITKYNPKNRNKYGHYIIEEWTSISDIGKNLTKKNYYKIEKCYSDFIITILKEFNYESLNILGVEKAFCWKSFNKTTKKWLGKQGKVLFKLLKNNQKYELDLENIEIIIKMFLREMIGGIIYGNKIEIKIGYDYYMYILTSDKNITEYLKNIKDNTLFIEEVDYEIFDIDEDIKKEIGYNEEHLK